MKLLTSLLFLLSLSSFAGTKLYLKDKCSQKNSSLLTPNGLSVELAISNYDANEMMTIKTEFFPINSVGQHVNLAPVAYTYHYNKANSWQGIFRRRLTLPESGFKVKLIMPKIRKLVKAERRLKSSNMWMVRVSWYQRGTPFSGVAQKRFLRLNSTEPFFEVTSAGTCHWETKAAVSSKLYSNPNMTMMNIIRDYDGISQMSVSRGLSLGPSDVDGLSPLNYGDNLVWFYRGWDQALETVGIESLHRKWVLLRHENGVFATRHSFTRKKANRWIWDWNENYTCKEYQKESEGHIDIGMMTEDFYILPSYLYSTEGMNEFMEEYRPSINTCINSVFNGAIDADETIINKDKSILYYYRD